MRSVGFALSEASLQELAYKKGIDQKVSSMTEAQKALLRYTAIVEQSAQMGMIGDLAKTLESPANALRVLQQQFQQLARTIGSVFIPMLVKVLPYIQAVTKVLTDMIRALATLVGFELPDWSKQTSTITSGVGGITDSLEDATGQAKKFKSVTMGFDELNIISPNQNTGTEGLGIGGDLPLDIEGVWDEALLQQISKKTDEIVAKMKEWLGISEKLNSWAEFFDTRLGKILKGAGAIGVSLAAWNISKGVLDFIDKISGLDAKGFDIKILGFTMFLADLKEFFDYFDDLVENGANIYNVGGMISEFAGMVGDALIMLGSLKVGGALKIVQGVGEIIVNIYDMTQNGVDWDNAMGAIRGLSDFAIGIGAFTGNLKVVAWGVAIQGFTKIIEEIGKNWDAIKQGDWSGVDKIALAIGAIEALAGVVFAISKFKKATEKLSGQGDKGIGSQVLRDLDTSISNATPSLSNLAKNIGMGVVILGELAAGAIILAGAIAVIGYELGHVAEAWQPVIDNGSTVLTALGLGSALLGAIGLVTYGLGTLGKTTAINIGVGTLVLLEVGVATGLFIAEIWSIGKGLDELGKAWQPVLDNGETIATGIALGTGLLVGIGLVTGALGTITVGSFGTLPIAIGIGTAVLLELSGAFILFNESLVSVADELSLKLAPSLSNLNEKLPTLTDYMNNFVDFMGDFASATVEYTKNSAISGLSATVDTIVGWFTQDPIQKLANDVEKINGQVDDLNEKLEIAVPELEKATGMLTQYRTFIEEIEKITNKDFNISNGIFANMKEVGKNLVVGLSTGMIENSPLLDNAITTITNTIKSKFTVEFGLSGNTSVYFNDIGTSMMNSFINAFKNKMAQLQAQLTELYELVKDIMWAAAREASSAASSIISSVNAAISALERLANAEAEADSKTSKIASAESGKGRSVSIQKFASGGFIEDGLFTMNRGEMAGKFDNGKSIVANNEQITNAISQAVYKAIKEASFGNNDDSNEKPIELKVYLDGKQIASTVKRIEKESGANIYKGGVLNV